jgi:hypothetical protein
MEPMLIKNGYKKKEKEGDIYFEKTYYPNQTN